MRKLIDKEEFQMDYSDIEDQCVDMFTIALMKEKFYFFNNNLIL